MDDKFEENQKPLEESTPLESTPAPENPETLETPKPFGLDPDPEPEPAQNSYATVPTRGKRSPKKLLFYLVGLVVLVFILFNGVKLISSKFNKPSPTPTPVAVETPTPTPSSTEQPSSSPVATSTPTPSINPVDSATGLDRSKLSVMIENGSGAAGVAGKASDFLKALGYNVVSTGNASNFNFTNVTIQVTALKKAYLPLLNKDLSNNYSVGTTSADLSATSSADAVVIIGK